MNASSCRQLSDEMIHELCVARLPDFVLAEVTRWTQHGKVNGIYVLNLRRKTTGESVELVLKVGHSQWVSGSKVRGEANALLALHQLLPDVPVPKVILYEDCVANSSLNHGYIVIERLQGVPLATKWTTYTDSDKEIVLSQLASHVARLKTLRFSSIGNFSKCGLEVGNLVALEWRSPAEVAAGQPPATIGPVGSFAQFLLAFYDRHLQLIEAGDDDSIKFLVPKLKLFRKLRLETLEEPNGGGEDFLFTHGDLNQYNILVDTTTDGTPKITGFLDFEWALSAPAEIEFHRGFQWIQTPDQARWWTYFLAQLRLQGVNLPPTWERRYIACVAERLVSRLESYRTFYHGEEQARALARFLEQLMPILDAID